MSWNPYIYTQSNPVNRIDPTGYADAEEEGIADDQIGSNAVDDLKSISRKKEKIQNGDDVDGIIDSIQKSEDRVKHLLDRITQGDYNPDDW